MYLQYMMKYARSDLLDMLCKAMWVGVSLSSYIQHPFLQDLSLFE